VNPLPSKQELLDFQARWMRPAGVCAIAGAVLLVAAGFVGRVGSADTTAEQLQDYQDHSSQLLLSSVVSAIGLLLFACPLYFLFFSARGRSERVRSFIGPLILVGALLAGVQGPVVSLGLKDASDDYAAGVGAVEAKARQTQPTEPPTRAKTTTTTGSSTTGSTTTAQRTPERRASDAKESFADDKVDDSSKIQAGRIIGLIGALSLIVGTVYTLIWSMRTGLLTRFMAALGIAFVAALLLIPQLGPIGTVLWFAVLGLMLAGWWPRPLPPAWAAGEAIPWPGREDIGPPPDRGAPGTVEGSGREVSEQPLPENGGGEATPPGETPGQLRKKRKRRK
jgi:hypothetical protein